MKSNARLLLAALVVLAVAACSDRPAPTAPLDRFRGGANATEACATYTELTGLVNDVFGQGSPDANSALSKLKSVQRALQKGDTASAQGAARNLIRFVLDKAATLPGQDYVPALIAGVECYSGLREDYYLVYPLDEPQVLVTETGLSGIQFDGDPVDYPTLITITELQPGDTAGLLDTKLDKYPGFLSITQESADPDGNALKKPAVVAVCASGVPSLEVASRLRLGHQASAGFEITPAVEPTVLDFLTCPDPFGTSAISALPEWMQSVANLLLPKVAHASVASAYFFGGGVGGSVTEFSPFAPVDPKLSIGGGVGGSVTEYIRVPAPSSPNGPSTTSDPAPLDREARRTQVAGNTFLVTTTALATAGSCAEGYVGTALAKECRPLVTITTFNGTILTGVPVEFSVTAGGGSVAIDNPAGDAKDCATFGSTAASTTNVNGEVAACWTLGAEGTNSLLATATHGGDAPVGVSFEPATTPFTVTALKADATLTLSGTTQPYTGSPIAVGVTTVPADLQTVTVTYDGSPTTPTAAGTYAVVATLDNASFEGTVSGTLTIQKVAAPLAFAVSAPEGATFVYGTSTQLLSGGGSAEPSPVTFSAAGSTACSVTSGGLLSIDRGTGSCTVTATKAASQNYEAVTSAPFSITPVKAPAQLSFGGASSFVYDGQPKGWTVSTVPAGLAEVFVSYGPETPIQVGAYAVTATLANDDYQAEPASGSFTITPAAQDDLVITGAGSIAFGGSALTLGSDGGSGGGLVTFSHGASDACAVTPEGVVTATKGTGTCVITATKAADRNYFEATSAPVAIDVAKAIATLSLDGLAQTYDGAGKSATVTTDPAGLAVVSVTYDGGAALPVDAGSYAVVATLTNADFAAAQATGTLVIAPAQQAALTLTAPATATAGTTVSIAASGGSGLGAVSYSTTTPTACAVDGSTGAVSILTGVGSCAVSAARAGDGNHLPSAPVSATIALLQASQSISFGPLSARTYGDAPFTVSATAPGGPVGFAAVAGSACTVSGSTVSLTGAGTCAVIATQPGGDYYAAAPAVTQGFSVAKAAATATAGSGSIVIGSPVPSLPCTVGGLLASDAGSVTCTTAVPAITTGGSYVTTPIVNPADPASYAVAKVNGTLAVTYAKRDCFAEPIKPIVPTTTSGITKGATLQVRCTLLDANGAVVTTATGDLTVRDGGTTGTRGAVVLSVPNAFRLSSGVYSYKLSTGGLIKGHFYLVTSRWNDGTETEGWFYMNK